VEGLPVSEAIHDAAGDSEELALFGPEVLENQVRGQPQRKVFTAVIV
jgi:hypothetical protein